MQIEWYCLEKLDVDQQGGIAAIVVVPSASPWFSGHFPGNPILPAIAQLGIVFDVIQKASEGAITPKSVHRIKYRRIIRPDESIHINLVQTKDKPDTFSFQSMVDEELACKGRILTDVAK